MPLEVEKNGNYGGDLVTQKYQPLMPPVLAGGDRAACTGLFNGRIAALAAPARLPKQLIFLTEGRFNGIIRTNETRPAAHPPLFVISSNRSKWIAKGFKRAQQTLDYSGIGHYDGVDDLRALKKQSGEDDLPSPAWYCPLRINDGNRQVYVIVHKDEYVQYRDVLAEYQNITVVGWMFAITKGEIDAGQFSYAGFGASRYAAIQFGKKLMQVTGAGGAAVPWNKIWLVDDNVVYLSNFPGLNTSEVYMAAHPGLYALGFNGCTKTEATERVITLARNTWVDNSAGQYAGLADIGLLQQCVLWNLANLNHLNFSPYFITSAEDTSFTNYLKLKGHPYKFSEAVSVKKETPSEYDNGVGAGKVNAARNHYIGLFAAAEDNLTVHAKAAHGGDQILRNFIDTYVLPGSALDAQKNDVNVQKKAVSQAVEQFLAAAVSKGFEPYETFYPNGRDGHPPDPGVQGVIVQ